MHKLLKLLKNILTNNFFLSSPLLVILCIYLVPNSFAQNPFEFTYQNYTAFQIYEDYELVAGRNRLRVQLTQSTPFGNFYAEADLLDRYTPNDETEILPREIYAEWFTPSYDIRVGKQKIVWGKATGSFVNDILTPVDLSEFLTQDMADLRIGLTALNIQRYFGSNFLQLVASPAPSYDRLPASDSRWFPVQTISGSLPISFRPPDTGFDIQTIQSAIRFAWRPSLSLSLDFMIYYWDHPMPAFAIRPPSFSFVSLPEIRLRETYKTSPMAGYSASWQINDGWLLTSESLFVNERLFTFLPVSVNRLEAALENPTEALQVLQEFDIRDDGYLLTKPWYQQMVGFQTSVFGITVGAQGFLEIIINYEDRILPQKLFPYVTGFAQRSFLNDRLQAVSIARYNIYGQDFWTQLSAQYEIADGFEFTLGTNIFGGPSISPFYGHLTFQQYKENSFLFAKTSVYF